MPGEASPHQPLIGTTLGHYRILEKIGAGGMGEVYSAQDEHLEREVAIKVLPAGVLGDEESRKRFRKEALALSKLNHPNVATIHDFDTQNGVDFLVMEYIAGVNLRDLIAGRSLKEKEISAFGVQLARGLAAAHEKGVIHRDLKPGNLLITGDGRLKILDFGLAKLLDPLLGAVKGETLTESVDEARWSGTLPYMAPEQLGGEPIDARTDIYGAGTVLYEMATQRPGFRRDTTPQLLNAILHEPVVAPRAITSRISPEMERIILKCLEKDPERRFQSASELAIDLERFGNPSGSHVRHPIERSLRETVRSSVRRHPLAFGSGGLLVALLAVLTWWMFGARPVLSFAPRDFILISEFDNQTGEALFDRSLLTALSVSIEQSAHVNVVPPARLAESLKRMAKNPGDKVDESVGRQICLRESVRMLLVPSIVRAGQQYALSARLVEPQSGVSVWSHMEMASGQDQVLPALGRLAKQVRRGLGESWFAMQRQDRPLPLLTTSSLSALKMYADGQDQWRKGQYHAAMQLFQSALQADPDFAMAHVAVGGALYTYIFNNPIEGKKHYERALELSSRTSERERLFARAMFASSQNHFTDAMLEAQQYLEAYPDDTSMRFTLAHLLRDNDRCPEAIEEYKEVLRLNPHSAASMIDIATCNVTMKNLPEAVRYYEQAFELEPSWKKGGNLTHEYSMALVRAGQETKAREVLTAALDNADTRPLTLRSLAYLDMYHGQYRAAREALGEALLLNESRKAGLSTARDHCIMSLVFEGQGDSKARLRELDAALQLYSGINDQVMSGVWLVRGFARTGQVDRAAAVLDTMKKQADMNDASRASLVNFSEAEVDRERGNYAHAIDLLLLAEHQHHNPYNLDGLARAYQAAGNKTEAERWLKALQDSWPIGFEAQPDYTASFLRLARLEDAKGDKEGARSLLSQFLELWKDADADLPLLKEAKAEYSKLL